MKILGLSLPCASVKVSFSAIFLSHVKIRFLRSLLSKIEHGE